MVAAAVESELETAEPKGSKAVRGDSVSVETAIGHQESKVRSN